MRRNRSGQIKDNINIIGNFREAFCQVEGHKTFIGDEGVIDVEGFICAYRVFQIESDIGGYWSFASRAFGLVDSNSHMRSRNLRVSDISILSIISKLSIVIITQIISLVWLPFRKLLPCSRPGLSAIFILLASGAASADCAQ